jgi:hypothetical protein
LRLSQRAIHSAARLHRSFASLRMTEPALEVLAKFGESAHDEQLLIRRSGIHFLMFEDPGVSVRDEDRVESGGERGIDI